MEKVVNTQKNEHAENVAAKTDATLKAKKAASAKAFAERQKALKAERAEAIKELKAFAEKNNLKFPEKVAAWIEKESNPVVRSANAGTSFLHKVFGDSPKVGDSITLFDYMKKTLLAKADMDKRVKKWAEKGIVVEFVAKPNMLESTYVIKKI